MKQSWLAMGAVTLIAAPAAQAQGSATVREIVRVVKAGRAGTPALFDAKIGTGLGTGDRVRTAGRSAAGVRFADKSVLRLGELTEVVITGGKAQVLRGQVVADYKRPGTITSGYAVAAVRGTVVHFLVDEAKKQAQVNCYEGRVFVSSPDNPISAGSVTTITGTQLIDPALQGDTGTWVGARIQFVDGPYNGQNRAITAFDPATGTVTFNPALPAAPAGATHGYLLVARPERTIVELRNNMGTIVPQGGSPSQPFNVPAQAFAMLQENPFFRQLADGKALLVYPNTEELDNQKRETFVTREAIDRASRIPRIVDCGHEGEGPGGGDPRRHNGCFHGVRQVVAQNFAQATPPPPPIREERILPGNIYPAFTGDSGADQKIALRVEPFAIASDEADSAGARLRVQGVSGNVYAEAGYRFVNSNGNNEHDLSEGYVHVRGRYGDLIVGRQHLYPSPANNTNIGNLLGLETSDAVVYQVPLRGGYRQEVGYVSDTQALRPGGFKAVYARGLAPLLKGRVGYSILGALEEDSEVGWSLDTAQSVIPNVLDVYAEGGRGVKGRGIYTAGLYVPALYHSARLDMFVEYANREGRQERVSLRLRRDMGRGLLLVGFLDRNLGDSFFSAGGGVLYSHAFK